MSEIIRQVAIELGNGQPVPIGPYTYPLATRKVTRNGATVNGRRQFRGAALSWSGHRPAR
jgi:hypothetical protein